jgi:hypothetical protein
MARPMLAQGRVGVRSGPRRIPLVYVPPSVEEFLFWARENPRPHGMTEPRDISTLSPGGRAWVESMGFDPEDLGEPSADDLEDWAEAEVGESETVEEFSERRWKRTMNEAAAYIHEREAEKAAAQAALDEAEDAAREGEFGPPEWDGFQEFSALSSADRALIEGLPGLRPTRGLSAVPPSAPTRLDVSNPPLRPSSSLPPLAGISPTRGLPGLIHAASGEPPRQGRAHPEGVPAPYEPFPELSPEQAERNREGIRKARETLRNPRPGRHRPPADMPLPKGDQGSLMEPPDMSNTMASYEDMLDSLPDRAAAALQRRQSTSDGGPLGNAPDWLDEVLLMIAAGGAATLLPPVGGAALLGGAAMLAP